MSSPKAQARALRSAARFAWCSAVHAALPRLAATALAGGCALGFAADAPPPAEADPLALEAEPAKPSRNTARAGGTKFFVEGAAGWASQRYGQDGRFIGRATADLRHVQRLGASVQATLSARIDATDPEDQRIDGAVFSLREAYGAWQSADAGQALEFGRINLREGPAYGYNPTDHFRANALRTITSANPATQRENRLGTVMLRGQALWSSVSLAAAYAPKLENRASNQGWSADLGATNDRQRALLTVGNRWTEKVNTQLSFFKQAGQEVQTGVSGSALLSDAVVAHGEWTTGRQPRAGESGLRRLSRAALGLTYTTASKLSLTAEWHYNGTALDDGAYQRLRTSAPETLPGYYLGRLAAQDNASRHAAFFYVTQRDLVLKNLELTALLKMNASDDSRLAWFDLRYRLDSFDVALQWQHTHGAAGTEYGSAPLRNSVGLVVTAYF